MFWDVLRILSRQERKRILHFLKLRDCRGANVAIDRGRERDVYHDFPVQKSPSLAGEWIVCPNLVTGYRHLQSLAYFERSQRLQTVVIPPRGWKWSSNGLIA